MNRYITRGILDDLAAGRSVLVISPSLAEAEHAYDQLVDRLYATPPAEHDDQTYTFSRRNGGHWVRDDNTKTAAVFVSIGSAMVDHAGGDVVVVNGYRRMIGDGHDPAATGRDLARLSGIIGDRDRVVID